MIQIRPVTQSQFLVTMSPFQHYWTSFTGIKDTATASQYPDGVRQRIYQLRGPKALSEVTFTSPFDPEKHSDVVDFWKSSSCDFIAATVQPVTCGENPQPLGSRTLIIIDAQMTSLNFGQVDRSSGNPSTIETTLVFNDFTYA